MIRCPNKSHPDWISLVEKYGEDIAYKKYIENDYNIPEFNKNSKTLIENSTGIFGDFFKSKSTLDSLEKHPKLFSKIVDELKQKFPEVRISKDGLIDQEGNYIEIPPGKSGMHYKNAIFSAIAYSNDSHIETVPHEYVHEYIDMYRNTDIVNIAIKKYGEERLVTLIGRKYTGQKMSNYLEDFISKFWKSIRNTFGHYDIVDILTDHFSNNEKLGDPISRGNSIYNYQDIQKPMNKKTSILDHNDDIKKIKKENVLKSRKDVIESISNDFKNSGLFEDNDSSVLKFENWWLDLKSKLSIVSQMDQGKGDSSNYSAVDDARISFVNKFLIQDKESKNNILLKIKGENIDLSKEENNALNIISDIVIAIDHKKKINNSYLDNNGSNIISKSVIDKIIDDEISNQTKKREKSLKSKSKFVQNLTGALNKGLRYVTNTRLWSKYLSGGENTMFSKLVYKKLNDSLEKFSEFIIDFDDFFKTNSSYFSKGSFFRNPDLDIKDIDTINFKLSDNLNPNILDKSLDLTKSEVLNIYLMLKRDGASDNIRKEGFHIKSIKGRDFDLSNVYKLNDQQYQEIINTIENDSNTVQLVNEIRNSMKYSYDKVNSSFRMLEGYDLENESNYFPVFHGVENTDISKKKNLIEDMRSLRRFTGQGGPLRIEDTFQVLNNLKNFNASYYSYAIPISNAQKALNSVKNKFKTKDHSKYLEAIQGTIDKMQDSTTLYSNQGDADISKQINKLQGNFAVALLAKNLGVVFKQQVSLVTAQEEINSKYIRKAGASLGPVSFINPMKLLRSLSYTGLKGGETMMPIEWNQVTDNQDYKELIKHPLFRKRFEGIVSRETGEAIMGKDISQDRIKLPWIKNKDGSSIYITKSRLMQSITIMDTLTILRLYNAVKLETKDRMNESSFKNLSEEQIEQHNVNRLQQIVDKTQPTFDQVNRTGLSQSSNPIARSLTMFSSATQKMSMLMLEGAIDLINDPTKENKIKFLKRSINVAVTTSVMLTTIDLIRYSALNGWDDEDDDKLIENYAISSLKTTLGSIQGVGSVLNVVISQLDSNPFYQTLQDPSQLIVQEGAESIANLFKGNLDKSLKGAIGSISKSTGLPYNMYLNTSKILDHISD